MANLILNRSSQAIALKIVGSCAKFQTITPKRYTSPVPTFVPGTYRRCQSTSLVPFPRPCHMGNRVTLGVSFCSPLFVWCMYQCCRVDFHQIGPICEPGYGFLIYHILFHKSQVRSIFNCFSFTVISINAADELQQWFSVTCDSILQIIALSLFNTSLVDCDHLLPLKLAGI